MFGKYDFNSKKTLIIYINESNLSDRIIIIRAYNIRIKRIDRLIERQNLKFRNHVIKEIIRIRICK